MNVIIEETVEMTVVHLEGDLDGKTGPAIQEQLLPFVTEYRNLVLDLSKIDFMSSAGLRVLLSLQRQMTFKGRFVLVGLSQQIINTMSVTGLLELFSVAKATTDIQW